MVTKELYKNLEYHISSRNIKALFTGKTDHMKHYDNHIVELQNSVGLKGYESSKKIKLTNPISLKIDFSSVMNRRKSERNYSNYKISFEELSTLFYYACGYKTNDVVRKNVPSSGGFNATEVFAIVLSSYDVDKGLYYFDAKSNTLNEIILGDFKEWIKYDAYYQKEWCEASVIFVLAANLTRLSQKYFARAYRLCLLDVGHVAENLYLTCAALDLKVCEVLGYLEREIEEALGIDGINVASFSTIVIGK